MNKIERVCDIPSTWFEYVSVGFGPRVRVAITPEFNDCFGEGRLGFEDKWITTAHFQSNRHAAYPQERLDKLWGELDQECIEVVGVSLTAVQGLRRYIEENLNMQPNPIEAGAELGLSRLLRRSEEKQLGVTPAPVEASYLKRVERLRLELNEPGFE